MPAVLYLLADPPRLGATALPMPWKAEPGKLCAISTAAIGYLAEILLAISKVQIRA